MSDFKQLWELPGFRSAFKDLIELDPTQIRLAALAATGDKDAEDDGLERGQSQEFRSAISVIETLLRVRDQDGYADLRDDIQALVPEAGRLLLSQLEPVLIEPVDSAVGRAIDRAQRALLPVLENVAFEVDVRRVVVPGQDRGILVPVLVARLDFDEPVGGGNATVTFQIPDAMAMQLAAIARRADAARSELAEALPSDLVPDAVRSPLFLKGDA